jgi:hypothetical protein
MRTCVRIGPLVVSRPILSELPKAHENFLTHLVSVPVRTFHQIPRSTAHPSPRIFSLTQFSQFELTTFGAARQWINSFLV